MQAFLVTLDGSLKIVDFVVPTLEPYFHIAGGTSGPYVVIGVSADVLLAGDLKEGVAPLAMADVLPFRLCPLE